MRAPAFPHLRILTGRGKDGPATRTGEQGSVHEGGGGYVGMSELGWGSYTFAAERKRGVFPVGNGVMSGEKRKEISQLPS